MKRLVWILAATAVLVGAQDKQTSPVTNVEITVYLLSGSPQGAADDVPQDLGSTVKQLHSVFAYKSYKLSESFILRGRSGNALTEGILPGNGLHYSFRYNGVRVSGDAPRAVHLDGLNLVLSRPSAPTKDGKQVSESVARIYTDLDIREGQKTVVGKSSINSTGDALILVIVPKIVE
jgi:hypothetical protein